MDGLVANFLVDSVGCLGPPTVGNHWELVDFPTEHWLYRVKFAGKHDGWILGSGGTILHWFASGTVSVREAEVDTKAVGFVLRQNYPNSFNSVTTIRYYLSQAARVQLINYALSVIAFNQSPCHDFSSSLHHQVLRDQ